MKRVFDLLASGVGLMVILPLLLLVAAAAVATSGFPVSFRQRRVGLHGREFTLLKFRTMTVGAEGSASVRQCVRGQGEAVDSGQCIGTSVRRGAGGGQVDQGSFEVGSARRVTSIGRFLRKTKLDELPQLWNVLKGDMSLVGPRPEVAQWVSVYPERWATVLSIRPGITDPASIQYRNEEKLLAAASDPERTYREEILPRKLDLYEEYVRTRTFWGDVLIILKTIKVVICGR